MKELTSIALLTTVWMEVSARLVWLLMRLDAQRVVPASFLQCSKKVKHSTNEPMLSVYEYSGLHCDGNIQKMRTSLNERSGSCWSIPPSFQ